MVNLTFVHDGPLFMDRDGNYYEFAYHNLLERYSYLADKIFFLIRTDSIESESRFTKVPEDITVIPVPNIKSPAKYLINKEKAEEIIRTQIEQSDIVILRTQSSIAQIAEKYVRKYKKPYIIECVGCSWDAYWNHSILGKIVAPYMEYRTKSAIYRASYVYYVTNRYLQKQYPAPKAKTVACSNVVINKPIEETLRRRLNKIADMRDGKIILGTAASIDTKYKGQQYVIRAMKRLKDSGITLKYYLAGGRNASNKEGESHLLTEARALGLVDDLVFCGNLSKAAMSRFYDDIDIYIQPSKQEGLPRAVVEAMSHGCPVIGSDLAGIPELIDKECLFKKGNVRAIEEKIKWILSADLEKYAKANFEKSKSYEYEILDSRRKVFYSSFLEDTMESVKS